MCSASSTRRISGCHSSTHKAAARHHIVRTLARNAEAHTFFVQMQVRQLGHDAVAPFAQRQRELL